MTVEHRPPTLDEVRDRAHAVGTWCGITALAGAVVIAILVEPFLRRYGALGLAGAWAIGLTGFGLMIWLPTTISTHITGWVPKQPLK